APKRRTLVGVKQASRVSKMYVVAGQMVKAGDVIAVLEADDAAASVAEALATLATSKAQVSGAVAALRDAKMQLDREQNLFRAGSTGKANVDAAKSKVSIASAAVAAASAEVRSAEARVARAKVGLASTRVVAPMSGKVLQK